MRTLKIPKFQLLVMRSVTQMVGQSSEEMRVFLLQVRLGLKLFSLSKYQCTRPGDESNVDYTDRAMILVY